MTTDLITIAIPVYNRLQFFEEAIQSAIRQTIQCPIIVIDNASGTDFFQKRCKELAVQYYRNDKNLGMFGNWDQCLKTGTSEYCIILADDDILHENYVERFFDCLKKEDLIDIYSCGFKSFGDHAYATNTKLIGMHTGLDYLDELKNRGPCIFPPSIVYRRKFYEETPGFELKGHGSYDWLWFYANCINASIYHNPEELYYYRKHEFSDSDINYRLTSFSWPLIYLEAAKSAERTAPRPARDLERLGLVKAAECLRLASHEEKQSYTLVCLQKRVEKSFAYQLLNHKLLNRILKYVEWRVNQAISINGSVWWWNLH